MAGNLTAMIAAAFSGSAAPPVTTDPYFNYTTLLLPGNGTNGAQNNTFLDGSTNNFTITRNGNTTQGTFSPFSQTGWGNYFNGSSYLSVADNAAFAFGSSDLTIECWVYATTSGASQGIAGQANSSVTASATSFILYLSSISKITVEFYVGSTLYLVTSSNNLVYNQWNHIAVVRDGGTIRLYINGQQDGTVAISGTINDSTNQLAIGRPGEYNSWYWNGYISNFRIVKGRCVYPSGTAFNPPTAPLTRTTGGTNPPQGTECSLLTCQSNSFLDSNGVNVPASSPLTITANGSPTVVAFSPFNPTASWSAATYGGSGYFDGSTDYLNGPNNAAFDFAAGDFTIEAFVYPTTASQLAFVARTETAGFVGFICSTTNFLASTTGSSWDVSITFTNALTANAWNHIAVVRNGNVYTAYKNGDANGTTTVSGTILSGSAALVVGRRSGQTDFSGYMSSLRLVKGTAVYTSNFTPPTAPLTAITNTSLLLNYTNAGIYDATSKNDLETVGNAQISTAINNPFGLATGNMYFDGTGDYLTSPYSLLTTTFNGSFSIQLFVYFSVLPNTKAFGMKLAGAGSGAGTGWYLQAGNGSNIFNITCYGSGPNLTSTSTIVAGQWYHVAVARIGSNCSLYINGAREATTASGSGAIGNSALTSLFIGTYSGDATNSSHQLNGYISNYKSVNGYSEYNPTSTNITVPTAAFPTL